MNEELVRKATKAMLEFRRAYVLLAESGTAALEILGSSPIMPNLIVLDLTMPGMTGKETLIQIREDYPGIPVIVSSGHQISIGEFDSLPGGGPEEIIPKPYTLKSFLEVVEAVLSR